MLPERQGRHREALGHAQQALGLYGDLGDRYEQADTLTRLGDTRDAAGHRGEAREAWQQALAILDELDHPGAAQVRARPRDLPQT